MSLVSRFGGRIWDPWREFGQLQHEMNRLLSGARVFNGGGPRAYPPVNLYANENNLLLTAELPGIDPEHVDITVTGATLTIKGERPPMAPQSGESFHRRERLGGQFAREISLPYEVDPTKTEASYHKGVLTVKMSRPESLKPRKVLVKSA